MLTVRAWRQAQAGRCPGCDGETSETTDPRNEDAYGVHLVTCFKCAARDRERRKFEAEGGAMAGVLVYTTGGTSYTVT